MLGFHPLGTQPISVLGDGDQAATQTVTLRYASQSFVTRSDDVPPLTFIGGRIKNIEALGRQLVAGDGGQFGSIAEARFGEIILDNADGALDPLANDYFADGRSIRLKIGATEIVAASRIMPQFIATGDGTSSASAAIDYSIDYPDDVIPSDLFIAQLTINDRGDGGGLTSVPTPWTLLDDSSNGPVYQALLYHFAVGTEGGTSASFNWQSTDGSNDCIVGRIHQWRYVDPDDPFEGLTAAVTGDLDSIGLPAVTTVEANSLATYWVSWADNVDTESPSGETGGDWTNVGDIVSTDLADGAANRRASAEMLTAGTITGGTIETTPTSPFVAAESVLVGVALQGLPAAGGQERVQPFSSFATVYTAVAGPWSLEHDILKLKIDDLSSRLQERMQLLTYSGVGGAQGADELTGRTRPLCFGHTPNVTAQLVDPSVLTYQVHSGSIEDIVAVYDQGIEVPFDGSPSSGQDYATYNLLAAASIPAGMYSTCLAEGYFRLGTTPTGAVTADVKGDNSGGYVDTHAGIIRLILVDLSTMTEANLEGNSFDDFDEAQPAEIGVFFPAGDSSTVAEAVELIAKSGGAFVGDRSGLIRIQRLEAPGTTQHWSFDDRTIISIEREIPAYGVPWKAWGVGFGRNWTVQKSGELAAGVTQARRQFLEAEYRYTYASSATIALAHQTSVGILKPTLFLDETDAQDEATRLIEFYALGRSLYRVTVKTALFSVHIGQTVFLKYRRWNLVSGKRFVVVAVQDDADTRETVIVCYG